MVDPIGNKPIAIAERRATQVAAVEPVAATQAVASRDPAAENQPATLLSRQMAANPPVNTERVTQIRKAIAEGRFPISPSTVADRLLALKLQWGSNDAS